MSPADRARRRLRSLRAVAAPGSGATPAERATANALAEKMGDGEQRSWRTAMTIEIQVGGA